MRRGAEGDLYETSWCGRRAVLKVRRPKGYRNPELDARIRRGRTVREAQMLQRAKAAGVPAPSVFFADADRCSIVMRHVGGGPASRASGGRLVGLARGMGALAGALHSAGIMHGDLTTSNFVVSGGRTYVVDFGLAASSRRPEDHAVDLRLFKEILNSAHAAEMPEAWPAFLAGYGSAAGRGRLAEIAALVSEIEARGRYAAVV